MVLGAFTAICVGLGLYAVLRDPKYLADYEKDVVRRHREDQASIALLHFATDEDKIRFYKLCRIFVKDKQLNRNPPRMTTKLFGFKKVTYSPFKVQVVECNEELSLMQTGEDRVAYLMRRGTKSKNFKKKKDVPRKLFRGIYYYHIRKKFKYDQENLAKIYVEEDSLEEGDYPDNPDQHCNGQPNTGQGQNLYAEEHRGTGERLPPTQYVPPMYDETVAQNHSSSGHNLSASAQFVYQEDEDEDEDDSSPSPPEGYLHHPNVENVDVRSAYKPHPPEFERPQLFATGPKYPPPYYQRYRPEPMEHHVFEDATGHTNVITAQ